jgi:hypothetical protein
MKKLFTISTISLLFLVTTWHTFAGLTGDFQRRFGASSRLLQAPLFFGAHELKKESPESYKTLKSCKKDRGSCKHLYQ